MLFFLLFHSCLTETVEFVAQGSNGETGEFSYINLFSKTYKIPSLFHVFVSFCVFNMERSLESATIQGTRFNSSWNTIIFPSRLLAFFYSGFMKAKHYSGLLIEQGKFSFHDSRAPVTCFVMAEKVRKVLKEGLFMKNILPQGSSKHW